MRFFFRLCSRCGSFWSCSTCWTLHSTGTTDNRRRYFRRSFSQRWKFRSLSSCPSEMYTGRFVFVFRVRYSKTSFLVSGRVRPIELYEEANLPTQILSNIRRAHFEEPTPIQRYTIPSIRQQDDIMACAQTGSGKTVKTNVWISTVFSLTKWNV